MLADNLKFKILRTCLLISLMITIIESQICEQIKQTNILVRRNGRMETVPMNETVKVCCEGYAPDAKYPWKCVSICTQGYIFENGKGCLPRCDECENGTCMAPNECLCEDDHVEVKGGCAPRCENECKNGYCAKPGVCGCNEGYMQSHDGTACAPICNENCENGFCEKPGECQCKPGYKWNVKEFKCRPKCLKPCQNGFCSATNECSCFKGHIHSSLNPYVCVQDLSAQYESPEDVKVLPPPSELPEVEGFFRYFGKRIHFVGHVNGVEDDMSNGL